MTKSDRAKLDRICAEAFARIEALEEKLYDRGFLSKRDMGVWYTGPLMAPGTKRSPFGPQPSAPVLKPVPGPLKGPGTRVSLKAI